MFDTVLDYLFAGLCLFTALITAIPAHAAEKRLALIIAKLPRCQNKLRS